MITAVDSSVLIALCRKEPGWESWSDCLRVAASEGGLSVCPVTFAEVAGGFSSGSALLELLTSLGFVYDAIRPDAAHLAGEVFREYRRQGGPRDHLIPDFLIAAHAQTQADRLAAIDRGYLRAYFPGLSLLRPE